MSLPLKDLRTSVDEVTDALLESHAQARSVTKSEIVREILSSWRHDQLAIHRSLEAELKRLGLNGYGDPSGRGQ